MRVGLMIPCYVDVFYPEAGIAALELLEKLRLISEARWFTQHRGSLLNCNHVAGQLRDVTLRVAFDFQRARDE